MRIALMPIDTWFFRDGTPFDQHASPQAGVRGLFPPAPPTVVGAVRAALAREHGWSGIGRWDAVLTRVLGDGPDDLGALSFMGPFVLRGGEPLFPVPRHVLGRVDGDGCWRPSTMLRPGVSAQCDLGDVRLPEAPASAESFDGGARCWVTRAGLRQILDGGLPAVEEIVRDNKLWAEEWRVGIQRSDARVVTEETGLYSTWHARPRRGVGIGVSVHGVPDGWAMPVGPIPFGGEHRQAACERWTADVSLERTRAVDGADCVVVVVATPALLTHDMVCGRADLDGPGRLRVICACMDRPLRIGGWDSSNRVPLPLRNAVPAGSTFFCEVGDRDALARGTPDGWLRVGAKTTAGFGLCGLGLPPSD